VSKDGRPPEEKGPIYYRISPSVWEQGWDEATVHLALYILTNQHRNTEGLFKLPKLYIMDDLGWSAEQLAEPFERLLTEGFIDYDDDAKVCLIMKALYWQAPANRNVGIAAMRRLQNVPRSRLDAEFSTAAQRFAEPFAKQLREQLPERFGKPIPLTHPQTSALLSSTQEEHARGREASPGAPPARTKSANQHCACGGELQYDGDGTGNKHCPVCEKRYPAPGGLAIPASHPAQTCTPDDGPKRVGAVIPEFGGRMPRDEAAEGEAS
jgi:hypothetical protein